MKGLSWINSAIVALATATFTACGEATGSKAAQPVSIGISHRDVIPAGTPFTMWARVSGSGDVGVPGIAVHWSVPAEAAQLDSVVTHTDQSGTASVRAVAATAPGNHGLTAQAAGLTGTSTLMIGPDTAVRLEIGTDSIRLTRILAYWRRPVRAYDEYGNLQPDLRSFELSTIGPFAAAFVDDSLSVGSDGSHVPGPGELVVRLIPAVDPARPVVARVKLVMEHVPASITLAGGLDTVTGIAVGESLPVQVIVRDSSGDQINADLEALGVRFFSSDSTVISVSSSGVLTGVRVGSAQVGARFGSLEYSVMLPVLAAYDLGSLHELYTLPLSQSYTFVRHPYINDAGHSLAVTDQHSRPCCGGLAKIELHDVNGAVRWTRESSLNAPVALSTSGTVFITAADPPRITSVDSQGVEMWSQPFPGAPVVDGLGVYLVESGGIRALSLDGMLLWSKTLDSSVTALVPSPTRLFVRVGQQLRAFDRGGLELWSRPYPGGGVADESSTYFGYAAPNLGAVDESGNTRWSVRIDSLESFMLGPSETLIVKTRWALRAIDRTSGHTMWHVSTVEQFGRLAAGRDKIYVLGSYVFVHEAATGALLGRTTNRMLILGGRCTAAGLVFHNVVVRRYDRC